MFFELFKKKKENKIKKGSIQDLIEESEKTGYGAIMEVTAKLEKISAEVQTDYTTAGIEFQSYKIKLDGQWIKLWNVKEEDQELIDKMIGYEVEATITATYRAAKLKLGTNAIALSKKAALQKTLNELDINDLKNARDINDHAFYEIEKLFDYDFEKGLRKVPKDIRETTQGISTAQKIATTLFIAQRQDKLQLPEKERSKNDRSNNGNKD